MQHSHEKQRLKEVLNIYIFKMTPIPEFKYNTRLVESRAEAINTHCKTEKQQCIKTSLIKTRNSTDTHRGREPVKLEVKYMQT